MLKAKLLEKPALILRVAFRNLWLYRLKTIIIATLLGMGSFLAVIGLTLLKDVESSMQESIIGSVAGHLQVYSKKAKDELAVFGSSFMGRQDLGVLEDLLPFRKAVLENPEVEAFIPMGIDMGMLARGNELDDSLDALRSSLKAQDTALLDERMDQLQFQLQQLEKELAERKRVVQDKAELEKQEAYLKEAQDSAFQARVRAGDEPALQFLETRIAPISGEKQPIYLMYLGTDIALYRENFQKFKVVKGDPLPVGQRGILLSNKIREDQLKNIAARIFDKLHKRVEKLRIPLVGDPENQRLVQDLPRQFSQILAYLDRGEASALRQAFDAFGIKTQESDLISGLIEQLKTFLQLAPDNFAARYQFFYEHIAPKIKLYEISPGETIMLRSYTKSGYLKSVPLKVYGVYSFDGLEDSDLAGAMNIIDLVSFRELYGQMTEASLKELQEMRAQVGIREVAAENAEDALFGEGSQNQGVELSSAAKPADPTATTLTIKPVIPDNFQPDEIARGLALNAAIKVKDVSRLNEVREKLQSDLQAQGLEVKVVDWQEASGFVGQFVNIVRLVLIFALAVIFIVALVIINNSIIVGTFNRMREIGTMRAIGAQKSFVVGMFLAETGITALIGALLGTVLAAILLAWLGRVGIASTHDVVTFLFSGPRLYPQLHPLIIVLSPIFVSLIATLASIYAARHAAHVKPAEAMQEKE